MSTNFCCFCILFLNNWTGTIVGNFSHSTSSFEIWRQIIILVLYCFFLMFCVCYRLEDLDSRLSLSSNAAGMKKCGFSIEDFTCMGRASNNPSKSFRRGMQKGSAGLKSFGRSLFPEDLKVSEKKIFDPQDRSLLLWNRLFVISCILAVSIDPLFFYLPIFNHESYCLGIDVNLAVTTTTLRTVIDAFYLIRMALQFRTAYIAPSSRVFGRGELVIDPGQIAKRYLQRYFIVDFLAVLPLPQVLRNI